MRGPVLRSLTAALVAAVLALARVDFAHADERAPVRVVYRGDDGCPQASAFSAELLARTARVRAASGDEEAREVRIDVGSTGAKSRGRLVIDGGGVREVDGATCPEVVSALALITALAFDPDAETGPVQAAPANGATAPGAAAAPASTTAAPATPSPKPSPRPRPNATPAPPPGGDADGYAGRAGRREAWHWTVGADLAFRGEITPRPLVGGGPSLQLRVPGPVGFIGRVGFEYATTGEFDEAGGGAVFTSATGALVGCVPVVQLGSSVFLAPCGEVTTGVLNGRGLERGAIVQSEEAPIWWAAGGLLGLARVEIARRVGVELRGGPSFPFVRRRFVFEVPPPEQVLVHDVPGVTWMLGASLGWMIR